MNNSKVITGKQLKDMLLGAYHSFEKNFEAINDLNVFRYRMAIPVLI